MKRRTQNFQKVKLNAPNNHASHWKTQSGDIELSQVHLETLILYVEKIEFKGSLQEVDTGLNTSWNPGLPWSTPPQITRKIDLSRRSPRQCNRLPRRPPAQRCQVLRSPSRPSNLSRGKNPDISPPGERGKSPASSDDGRDADEERCYRGSKEGGIHISWESEISCITWRWWRR